MSILDKLWIAVGLKQKPRANPVRKPIPIVKPPQSPIPPPAPTPQPAFVLTPAAATYLDAAWLLNQNRTLLLPVGTRLWHGGLIGPNNSPANAKGLWTTRNSQQRTHYNSWALQEAISKGVNAYLTEFETNKDLLLADFASYSLNPFTAALCNGAHNNMKQAVMAWLVKKSNLSGIVAINSGPDEVVISLPATDLTIIQQTVI
ncbi:hypothetical protein [Ferribacterium limneticum]|uniref:hypothetical protein n=1 Tax=Ferribacterium limneticum TaxID=76259 RepID=UPI001CFC3E9F|nr:hypothetical protein [Ferribacterium limneticum]UCV28456.1 hypothetical protein KI617_19815 [Ferribacterium limneticum]UCV32373.1 hypothetical protein KI608_19815 [Ferribacterium limneticum]